MSFATLLTKREECLTERVQSYENITKLSFNPYFSERSVQRFLKTKMTYIFISALFYATLKRFFEGTLSTFMKSLRDTPKEY